MSIAHNVRGAMRMRLCGYARACLWISLLALGGVQNHAYAAPRFPALTGRVVDAADMLSASARSQLAQVSENFERATTHQLVVVTLDSLQGYPIEDFGFQLGRAWGIGQKEKNNGVWLIVAPNERAVRIEVGYGLEGTLTDALASNIIQTQILPRFRRGDMEGGVVAGAQGIVAVFAGEYAPASSKQPSAHGPAMPWPAMIVIGAIVGQILARMFSRPLAGVVVGAGAATVIGIITGIWLTAAFVGLLIFLFVAFSGGGGPRMGGYRGGGFPGGGGGGFSGGGGSFGGGGASGRW